MNLTPRCRCSPSETDEDVTGPCLSLSALQISLFLSLSVSPAWVVVTADGILSMYVATKLVAHPKIVLSIALPAEICCYSDVVSSMSPVQHPQLMLRRKQRANE